MSIEKRLDSLEKQIKIIVKAQSKFYPKFDEIMKNQIKLIKAFNDLNKSAASMGNMAGLFGSVYEEHKDTISQIASQIEKSMKNPPAESPEKELTA